MTTPQQVSFGARNPADLDELTIPNLTFIDFLLDETGSMQSCANATMIGFDDYVAAQKSEGGECFLTLTKFDSTSIRTPYENLPISMVPPLSFHPGSTTNLYDCIGDRLAATLSQDRYGKSLFVIMTDGDDNASLRFTIESARTLIQQAQDNGIVVVFMGPDDTALNVGSKLGIPTGNIKSFHTDKMRETMSDLKAATKAYRAGNTDAKKFFA
jgi:hypothetical protein